MSERTLLLGYDLCDKKTQMAVYNRETMEPELIGQTEDNPDAALPTSIEMDDGTVFENFLPRIRRGEELVVGGKYSAPVNVMAYFFQKTLSLTRKKYPSETIKQLVVTVPDHDPKFVQIIYDALALLNIKKNRAVVISHKQSYLYFALYQKKELWINDVGMFDYNEDGLHYYQMQVDRRKSPVLAGVKERDYTEAMELSVTEEGKKAAVFENVVMGAIHKQVLSALYMTGDGFDGGWADEVLQKLCVGRRLFKGGNLYVSGACYAAKELGESARLSDFLLMDEDMISSHLCMTVYADAKEEELVLAKAGTPWYQVDEQVDFIPDGETEISLQAKNIFTKEQNDFLVELEPVLGKVDRHCRLTLRVRFADVNTCIVTVKDDGFGDIFPTSNRIWEKTIQMNGR
jgi:hypothetical protein